MRLIYLISLTIFLFVYVLLLSSCASMPSEYGQSVRIISGPYINSEGTMIDECSGFELYKVYIPRLKINACVRSWNMERL